MYIDGSSKADWSAAHSADNRCRVSVTELCVPDDNFLCVNVICCRYSCYPRIKNRSGAKADRSAAHSANFSGSAIAVSVIPITYNYLLGISVVYWFWTPSRRTVKYNWGSEADRSAAHGTHNCLTVIVGIVNVITYDYFLGVSIICNREIIKWHAWPWIKNDFCAKANRRTAHSTHNSSSSARITGVLIGYNHFIVVTIKTDCFICSCAAIEYNNCAKTYRRTTYSTDNGLPVKRVSLVWKDYNHLLSIGVISGSSISLLSCGIYYRRTNSLGNRRNNTNRPISINNNRLSTRQHPWRSGL